VLKKSSASISSLTHVPSSIYSVSHIPWDELPTGSIVKPTVPVAMTPIPYSSARVYPSAEPIRAGPEGVLKPLSDTREVWHYPCGARCGRSPCVRVRWRSHMSATVEVSCEDEVLRCLGPIVR
jgi:hypothetical protein